MNQMNILVTSPSFMKVDGEHKNLLETHFKNIDYFPGPHDNNSMIKFANLYDGIICGDDIITLEFIKKSIPKLKVVSKYGIGLDKIDVKSLKLNNIRLFNCAGVNSLTVAEHALGSIISGLRNTLFSVIDTHNSVWNRLIGRDLSTSKIGIIGYGNVGKDLEKLLIPLANELFIYDINLDDHKKINNSNYLNDIKEVYKNADVICLCLSLNKNTSGLINNEVVNLFKNEMILINVSRGEIVNEMAILNGINNNKIKYYITDVLEDEINFLNSKLVNNERVFITPHIASRTSDNIKNQGKMSVENLIKGFKIL